MSILEIATNYLETLEDQPYDKLSALIDELEELQEDIKTDYKQIANSQTDTTIDLFFWLQELKEQKEKEEIIIEKIKKICKIN